MSDTHDLPKQNYVMGIILNNMKEVKVNLETSSPVLESNGDNYSGKCELIKACIDSFLEKNPKMSLQSVEDKTGVPCSTLRRIITLKGNPQPEAVIKIFLALGFDNELVTYMKEHHPEIATVMALKSIHNQEYDFVSESHREFFTSDDYFLLINLAYTENGTNEDEIAYELGRKGLERLHELLEKGIVAKDEHGRYIGKLQNYKLSFSDTKKRVELALRYYRLEEAGNINNWMSFQTESLNEEGLKLLKTLQQKHFNERKEQIFNNPMYNGNLKVYSATVSSTFLAYTELGELQ